jgi:hypothetical protein
MPSDPDKKYKVKPIFDVTDMAKAPLAHDAVLDPSGKYRCATSIELHDPEKAADAEEDSWAGNRWNDVEGAFVTHVRDKFNKITGDLKRGEETVLAYPVAHKLQKKLHDAVGELFAKFGDKHPAAKAKRK